MISPSWTDPPALFGQGSSTLSQIPWDGVTLAILGLAGVVGLSVFIVDSLADLRDKLVKAGFIAKESWLGRQLVRRKKFDLRELLDEIGFTDERRAFVKEAQSREWAAVRAKGVDTSRLVEELLGTMKRCMVEEKEGREFRPTTGKFYVDIMGATSALDPSEWDFAVVLAKWLHILRKESVIPDFDAILVPKNGNPTLVHHAASYYSISNPPKVFAWKSLQDHSRVVRGNPDQPHFLDFEGLWACEKALENPSKKLRVITVDDNFTSGTTLSKAIEQFNNLVRDEQHPFEPINTVVTLFAVRSDNAEENFQKLSADFTVHALVSVGPPELAKLASTTVSNLMKDLGDFQRSFSCRESRRLT